MIGVFANPDRIWRQEPNPDVTHLYKKEVTCAVHFKDDTGIALGTVLTTPDKARKGIVIELDDAKIVDDFIIVWWSDGNRYGRRHTFDEIKNGKFVIER